MGALLNSSRFALGGIPFSAVSLLMGFEGSDGSTSFTDESSFAHAMTAGGDAQIDTAQFKFGSSSYLGDGTGDIVSAADHAAFEFAAGEFTIEGFVRFGAISRTQGLFGKQSNSTAGHMWGIHCDSSNNVIFRVASTNSGGTPTDVSAAPGFTTGVWYHVAADRDASNKMRLYWDGAMVASTTSAINIPDSSGTMRVGSLSISASVRSLNGWLDEVRITKGYARYASDAGFTVPTAAYPRS